MPVDVSPLERPEFTKAQACPESAEHERIPLGIPGTRSLDQYGDFVARVGIDDEPLQRIWVAELAAETTGPERRIRNKLAVLDSFRQDCAERT
jgi:hypothetical protein